MNIIYHQSQITTNFYFTNFFNKRYEFVAYFSCGFIFNNGQFL